VVSLAMRAFLLFLAVAAALLLAACPVSAFTASTPPTLTHAPLIQATNRSSVVPDQFMVQTDSNVSTNLLLHGGLTSAFGALTGLLKPLPIGLSINFNVLYTYQYALTGFALKLSVNNPLNVAFPALYPNAAAVLDFALTTLLSQPGIVLVEEDCVLAVSALQNEDNVVWGIDRVDQRGDMLDSRYYYNTTASNVHAYVIDTGIRITHEDFEGRAVYAFNAFDSSTPVEAADGQGHGTHVAGTIGSKTWGLAKKVNLYAVKVLQDDGTGTDSSVTAGLDYVQQNAQFPAVAVMSLGGGVSSTLDTAVKNVVNAGVSVVVAAGNSNVSACESSPADVDVAITVAASDITDTRASFSNFGPCATLFAPGVGITSCSNADDTSSRVLSGTSMAAPHVAGAVALYLSNNPSASPAQTKSDVICYSTKDAVADVQGTPNRFLFSFINLNADSQSQTGTTLPPAGTDTTTAPDDNSQSEQCSSSSPCQGPFTPTISTAGGSVSFVYNTTAAGGYHRGWLSYNPGSSSCGLLCTQAVAQNSLSLQRYSDAMQAWETMASATDSSTSKSIAYEDTDSSSPAAGSTWAWVVTAQQKTPTAINFSYKEPAAPADTPAQPAPAPVDQCSATSYFDPNPGNPNNVGQDPTPRSNSDQDGDGSNAAATAAGVPVFVLAAAMLSALLAASQCM